MTQSDSCDTGLSEETNNGTCSGLQTSSGPVGANNWKTSFSSMCCRMHYAVVVIMRNFGKNLGATVRMGSGRRKEPGLQS